MSKVYTVVGRSIIMSGSRIVKPGEQLSLSEFKGKEKQVRILIEEGVLVEGEVEAEQIDLVRADGDHLPGLPVDTDKDGQKVLSPRFQGQVRSQDKAKQKLAQIKAAQAKAAEKSAQKPAKLPVQRSGQKVLTDSQRAAVLAQNEGEELTVDEARSLGLVK